MCVRSDDKSNELEERLITQISFCNSEADNSIGIASDSAQMQQNNISKVYKTNILSLNRQIKETKENIKKSLWGKIKIFLAEKLNIEKLMDQRVIEIEKVIEDFTKKYNESIAEIKTELATKIAEIEINRKNNIQASKNKTKIDIEKLLKELNIFIKEELKDFRKISDGLSIEEVTEKIDNTLILLEEAKNIDYFFIDDFEKEYMHTFKGKDTGTHTDNFFLSLHLLEGLLLKELMRESIISNRIENECFACGKKTLRRENKEKDSYLCTSCKARFINNELKSIKRPLNNQEIKDVLKRGYVEIEKQTYVLEAGKPPFWNIVKSSLCKITDDIERNFRYASVFFPIVNTTCHSFGSVFNINENNTIPERFIDTLFMDESGMILVPFLVNLYAGKKVILFGDEKQIEPVYPFKDHGEVCNNILSK